MPDLAPNRREAYRYSPPPARAPRLTIVHGGQRSIAERVEDINSRGTRVEFAVGNAPALTPGSAVTVSGFAPGLDGCVDIPARVVFSAVKERPDGTARVIVGLLFTALPDVAGRADGEFFGIFNRRAIPRAEETD